MKDTKIYPCPGLIPKGKITRERCGRLPSPTSIFCPKHELIDGEQDAEFERRREALKAKREKEQSMRDMLPTSPLRAENPQFAQGSVDRTYSK